MRLGFFSFLIVVMTAIVLNLLSGCAKEEDESKRGKGRLTVLGV